MKKIAIAVLSAVCVFALAGCADDVTMDNEQNDIVAEYIAGTLLRHSYANEWKYSKLSNPTFNKSGQISPRTKIKALSFSPLTSKTISVITSPSVLP